MYLNYATAAIKPDPAPWVDVARQQAIGRGFVAAMNDYTSITLAQSTGANAQYANIPTAYESDTPTDMSVQGTQTVLSVLPITAPSCGAGYQLASTAPVAAPVVQPHPVNLLLGGLLAFVALY